MERVRKNYKEEEELLSLSSKEQQQKEEEEKVCASPQKVQEGNDGGRTLSEPTGGQTLPRSTLGVKNTLFLSSKEQ